MCPMKSVSHIFGNEAKVKLMRLFVFNPNEIYSSQDISERIQEKRPVVSRELRNLSQAELISKRSKGWVLNHRYPYLEALKQFLVDASPITDKELVKKISRAGSVKLVLVSGIFLHDPEARVDLLVVGDGFKKGMLTQSINGIEAQLGREIRYAFFETQDFLYRLGLYDKLVRDILDFNHKKIVNKIGV